MPAHSKTLQLLQGAFRPEEWEYLAEHGAFKHQLEKDDGSLKSFENLVEIGSLLLRQRHESGRGRQNI